MEQVNATKKGVEWKARDGAEMEIIGVERQDGATVIISISVSAVKV